MGDFLCCSAEAKAREEFCKAVIELFGDDVGMARKLLGELLPLRAQHSNMVFRNKVLRERHDLPVDRLPVHDAVVALQAERDQLRAENEELRKDAERWRFIRDEWPKLKLEPNGEWFNSCFLEREIDAAMNKEPSHVR